MKNTGFGAYVDKKKRESIRQLGIIKNMLENTGLKTESFLDSEDDPYIFCRSPVGSGSFDGIRLYKIGDQLAFRVQKEKKTHPYGKAYPLPIEEMFHDFLSDEDIDQMKAGKKVMEAVSREIRRFFEKSVDAEKEEREKGVEQSDSQGAVAVKSSGSDYSSMIYNKA